MHTETATAAEPIPFGSPVRATLDGMRVCKPAGMEGIAKRPPQPTYDSYYGRGEIILYQTDGEILATINNEAQWVDLREGVIV